MGNVPHLYYSTSPAHQKADLQEHWAAALLDLCLVQSMRDVFTLFALPSSGAVPRPNVLPTALKMFLRRTRLGQLSLLLEMEAAQEV